MERACLPRPTNHTTQPSGGGNPGGNSTMGRLIFNRPSTPPSLPASRRPRRHPARHAPRPPAGRQEHAGPAAHRWRPLGPLPDIRRCKGTLASARRDPAAFIASLDGPVVPDEVRRPADLFLAIKAPVDRDRRPGLTLWPLSQGELEGQRERFTDLVLSAGPLPPVSTPAGDDPSGGRPQRGFAVRYAPRRVPRGGGSRR